MMEEHTHRGVHLLYHLKGRKIIILSSMERRQEDGNQNKTEGGIRRRKRAFIFVFSKTHMAQCVLFLCHRAHLHKALSSSRPAPLSQLTWRNIIQRESPGEDKKVIDKGCTERKPFSFSLGEMCGKWIRDRRSFAPGCH